MLNSVMRSGTFSPHLRECSNREMAWREMSSSNYVSTAKRRDVKILNAVIKPEKAVAGKKNGLRSLVLRTKQIAHTAVKRIKCTSLRH